MSIWPRGFTKQVLFKLCQTISIEPRGFTKQVYFFLKLCQTISIWPRGFTKQVYLTNAIATPPSTLSTFPVDLFKAPPTKVKQALAISSGKIIWFNKVLLA